MPKPKPLESGDPVRLIRAPEIHGFITQVYDRGILRLFNVRFPDGTTELCTANELELN